MRPVRIACLMGSLVVLGGCSVGYSMPDNAQLLVNPQTGEYVSPPCVAREPARYRSFTLRTTLGGVRAARDAGQRMMPEPHCRDMIFGSGTMASGGFTESGRLRSNPSRWAPDGSWKW